MCVPVPLGGGGGQSSFMESNRASHVCAATGLWLTPAGPPASAPGRGRPALVPRPVGVEPLSAELGPSQRLSCFSVADLAAGERSKIFFEFTPRCTGAMQLHVDFSCSKFHHVKSFVLMNVAPAGSV